MTAGVRSRIYALWDELAGFGASEIDGALKHLLAVIGELVDAQNAYWLGVVRVGEDPTDPLFGWRPCAIRYLESHPVDETYARGQIRAMARGAHDEWTTEQARRAGSYRAFRLRDLVSQAWLEGDGCRDTYLARGIFDVLSVGAPVNDMAECYYGFHRKRAGECFDDGEREIGAYALRGLTWFHRQVLLAHGLPAARTPLSPSERRMLAMLLTHRTEKEIATELGLTPATAHTYASDVFRKLGVSGRAGLTALWLGADSL